MFYLLVNYDYLSTIFRGLYNNSETSWKILSHILFIGSEYFQGFVDVINGHCIRCETLQGHSALNKAICFQLQNGGEPSCTEELANVFNCAPKVLVSVKLIKSFLMCLPPSL